MTKALTRQFKQSSAWLKRAEKTIPLGSQTFSKSRIAYPNKVSPLLLNADKAVKYGTLTTINILTLSVGSYLCL